MTRQQLDAFNYRLGQIETAASRYWDRASRYPVQAFSGEMGAGKTTFVRAVGAHLGITDDISSPTFSIVNQYLLTGTTHSVYHVDLYRLRDEAEAIHSGIEDCLAQVVSNHDYALIEWPEKAPGILPKVYLCTFITSLGPDVREMAMYRIESW